MNDTNIKHHIGSVSIDIDEVVAGSHARFHLAYTAGRFGIDDSGSIKVCTRFASDMGSPQIDDPAGPNYVTVCASNGADLFVRFDPKMNVRPWGRTLYIKVVKGYLKEGDRIVVHYGDPCNGSPGMRMQTFAEDTFEFKVLVDAIATADYLEVPESPVIDIVPGPAAKWVAQIPTAVRSGESFRLLVKAEDEWGNPTGDGLEPVEPRSASPIDGLPERVDVDAFSGGACWVGPLTAGDGEVHRIVVRNAAGRALASSNPIRVLPETADLAPYWAELHGQSEETIGSNSARDYHEFARDKAGVDVIVHQGNDFQITNDFWKTLNDLAEEFLVEGEFVTFPGYEWSGNTGMGGDRNVIFRWPDSRIHRSSHALVDDLGDLDTDCHTATDLFKALHPDDALVISHVGGRYADIRQHDRELVRAVEVHSAWGTFEWMLEDALQLGYRVGIGANSDGHKGRPGASYPGASSFGSYGGLTCILAKSLTRHDIWDALKARHHYGTTGCRMLLDVRCRFRQDAESFLSDPAGADAPKGTSVRDAMMGDIVSITDESVAFSVDILAHSPIEKVEIRNGLDRVETARPYAPEDCGRRIRLLWSGAEYRGRGRETTWDGQLTIDGNEIESFRTLNFFNIEKTIEQRGAGRLAWTSITTGGEAGCDIMLASDHGGRLSFQSPVVEFDLDLAEIGSDDTVIDGGGMNRQVRLVRLPDENPHTSLSLEREIRIGPDRDNPVYVCVFLEDGHRAWSSPIYLL